ncbi:choice-of-anchor D domain-containing protein [Flavobacterium terrisoli]|uniref:choice-of-anchor D domain-containing protein n=1 Tax=Flavobacterium terrisoli TaxID=3242195 RepID=UPI0025438231|nr:choice-of-anchor D domain-containing protein [Flavobacterium buctense]
MKFRLLQVAFFVLLLNSSSSYGQLLQWNTNGNGGTETTEPSVANDANISSASLSFGAGVTPALNAHRFGGSNWWNTGNSTNSTLAEAIAGNDYIQFTVTPNAGYNFTPTSFVFQWERSGTGPSSVALRSSIDGYAANLGAVTGMAASLTTGNTITISGLTNITTATTFRLYGYGGTATGGTGGFDEAASPSIVNVVLNGTTALSAITTAQAGDWNTGATWIGGVVPTSAQNAVVNHAVTVTTAVTRDAGTTTAVNTGGGSLTISNTYTNNGTTNVTGNIQINNGGSVVGTNNLAYSGTTTTLTLNESAGLYAVTNKIWPVTGGPYNVTVQGTGAQINAAVGPVAGTLTVSQVLNCAAASALTVNGTLQINTNGYINTNAPIYGPSSLLKYNSGGAYNRSTEWTSDTATIGVTPGYPNNVQISNNTAFNYYNAATGPRAINGSLTIDSGSSLSFSGTSTVGALTVPGNVTNAGTLTLGVNVGDDIKTAGNFSNTGTFNGNNRAIWFTKASPGIQTVSSTTVPLVIPYVVTANGTTVQLLNSVTISAPTNGNAIVFGSSSDVIDLNGNTLIIGTAGVDSLISGTGGFKGSTSSIMTLNGGTGSIGTVKFVTDLNLATLTVNRTSGSIACVMGSNLTLNQAVSLNLTAGIVDLASYTMTTEGTINNAGATNYIIADNAFGGVLRRRISVTGTPYVYPIGDKTVTQEYSPAQINFTAGSFTTAYLGMSVNDAKHPNMDATTHFISRYWAVTTSGTFTSPTYTFTGTYLAGDVNGTETSSFANQWNGTAWLNNGANLGSSTLTITGATTLPATNHFSGGRRDQEINITQSSTNYLTGSTYDFGTVLTGTNNDVTFTIQNTGQNTLTLGATGSITGNPPYSIQTAYSGTTITALGTKTFIIRFAPSGAGTFTGSITITSNDADEPSYVINFTGIAVAPTPEINVKGIIGSNPSILSGDVTPDSLDNTQFAATNLGSNQTKSFRIENIGTLALNVTSITSSNPSEFTVTSSAPYSNIPFSGTNYVDFTITFNPQYVGLRTGTITIVHDDATGGESPYTFAVEGNGVCLATANTITPTSGPVGTEVTVTASANNLTGATVTLNSVSVTPVTQVSSTQIKITIPSGATTGSLVTTNSQGCTASNAFTVITNANMNCEGATTAFTDIIISEVYDSFAGSSGIIELYNPTLSAINLTTLDYRLARYTDSGAPITVLDLMGTIPARSTYLVAADASATLCTGLTLSGEQIGTGFNANDRIELRKNTTTAIDVVIGPNEVGYTIRRLTTATGPTTTFNAADWTFISDENCSDLGYFNLVGNLPVVTTHPTYTPTCKGTTLTVAGTEGYNAVGDTKELVYQWYAVAPNTATWTALSDNAIYTGTATATLDISDISTLVGYQYYCQIRENTVSCYAASNAVMITAGQSTTWNGTAWSNGAPTLDKAVIINGNYDTSVNGSFEACSVTVNGGFTLDIKANNYVSIKNDLTVSATGNLTVQNNGSLVMIEDDGVVTNNGTTQVIRTTAPFELYDYTYWSSPVDAASITTTFPDWRTDYSFEFNTANFSDTNTVDYYGTVTNPGVADSFDDFAPWAWQAYTGTMTNGKGYAIMGPTSLTFSPSATTSVTFSGKVNNGVISPSIVESGNAGNTADDFNLIGNPYPSAIFANTFITTNGAKTSGSLYFWTHVDDVLITNPGPDLYNFISDDYAVYNMTGGTRASYTGSSVPTGYIASGQGFFVEAQGNNTLTFNNAMRDKGYTNTQFFRSASAQPSMTNTRIWLNLRNADGLFGQLLVGYFDNTTLDFDWAYDARVNQTNNYLSFYSLAANEKYKIQARPTFDESDIVPIGYFSSVAGEFSISIDQKEGILNEESTNIYLQDLEMNIIHDLKASPYTFTTGSGKYENRFLLRYTDAALGNPDFELSNSVIVATNHGEVSIKSYVETIDEVIVYDILGRQLFQSKGINSNDFTATNISLSQQSLIVKVKLESGAIVTKKVLTN